MTARSAITAAAVLAVAALIGYFAGAIVPSDTTKGVVAQRLGAGFEPTVMNLGEQAWGRVLEFPLTLVNRSDKSLVIASAEPSCGCTVISSDWLAQKIPPRGRFQFNISLETLTNPGPKKRVVSVTFESGKSVSTTIVLDVVGTWTLDSDTVDFGRFVLGGEDEFAIVKECGRELISPRLGAFLVHGSRSPIYGGRGRPPLHWLSRSSSRRPPWRT